MTYDLLSAVLNSSGISGRQFALTNLASDKQVLFPCHRSLGVHIVINGPVYVHMEGECIRLEENDVVMMGRGYHHALSLSETTKPQKDVTVLEFDTPLPSQMPHLISGAYQFWHTPAHPLLHELPAFWKANKKGPDAKRLNQLIDIIATEIKQPQQGSQLLVKGLFDALLMACLRLFISMECHQHNWSHGTSDPVIYQALALMQNQITHPWSLDTLSESLGISRASFAEKFKTLTGTTPLQHLRTLRIQAAMNKLVETDHAIQEIASQVGYADGFAFSKAFKKVTGQSPKAFREIDRTEQNHIYRMHQN